MYTEFIKNMAAWIAANLACALCNMDSTTSPFQVDVTKKEKVALKYAQMHTTT
jgi:hypothetical protein